MLLFRPRDIGVIAMHIFRIVSTLGKKIDYISRDFARSYERFHGFYFLLSIVPQVEE